MKALSIAEYARGWVSLSVNLRRSQYELLSLIAERHGVSTSRVTRHILAHYLAELEKEKDRGSSDPDQP